MDLGLRGKIALVTAASRGLGRAVAEALATEGASLVICARGADALEEAGAAMAQRTGVDVEMVAADVATEQGIARVWQRARDRFGHVDGQHLVPVGEEVHSVQGPAERGSQRD